MSDKKTAVSSIATLPAARRSEDERSEAERSGAAGNVAPNPLPAPTPKLSPKPGAVALPAPTNSGYSSKPTQLRQPAPSARCYVGSVCIRRSW